MARSLLLLAAAGLAACRAALPLEEGARCPVPSWVYVQPGQAPGDWALYESFDGRRRVRWEVVAKRDGESELLWARLTPPARAPGPHDIVVRLRLDEDGQVLGCQRQRRGLRPATAPVAAPGEPNHVAGLKSVDLMKPEEMFTRGGRHQVERVIVLEQTLDEPSFEGPVSSLLFVDPATPFGVVRYHHVRRAALPAQELLERLAATAPAGSLEGSFAGWVVSRASGPGQSVGYELVGFGRRGARSK